MKKERRIIPTKRWILVGFFLFMIVCTIVSRVYDSITIPKVRTTTAKRKSVETIIEGTGTVKVRDKTYQTVMGGMRIGQVDVTLGSEVQEGDVLFRYDMEAMAEKKDELIQEIRQLALSLEKEQISQESYDQMTQAEAAQWELSLAQRELEEGQMEFEESVADYNEAMEQLEEDYYDNRNLTEEELWMQQERDWESAKNNLDTMKDNRDREVRAAQRKIEDIEEEIGMVTDGDEAALKKLEKQLKRAEEDLEDIESSWENQIDAARSQLEFANDQEDRIQSGMTTAQEAREENYKAAVKQEEEKLDAARKNMENLRKAVEQAQWQMAAAQKQDNAARLSQEQKNRMSQLTINGLELDKKIKERELSRLEELIGKGGQVTAREAGVVTDLEITAGKTATGEELVSLAVGNSQFEGTFVKEEQELTKGDTIEITIPGTTRRKEAVIDRMNLLGDTEGVFQADLGGMELALGTVTSYTCTRQSDIFTKVIPLSGLRKDMMGYYCLVARTRSSILGEEFRAERVNVQLILQGSHEAAVEGSIFENDAVITGEDKSIGEGDRVRPVS